jgi:hypothetical protein
MLLRFGRAHVLRWLLGALVWVSAGCKPDPGAACEQAYDHLASFAKRLKSVPRRERFLDACRAAFDEPRHACLMEARSAEEALVCRPKRAAP